MADGITKDQMRDLLLEQAKVIRGGSSGNSGGGGGGPASAGSSVFETITGKAVSAFNPLTAALGVASSAVDGIKTAYDTLEKTITPSLSTWRKLSDSGASFSNDIVSMSVAASGSRLTLDEFADVIKKNSGNFNGLGGNAAKGAEQFARLGKELMDSPVNDNLRRLGMTSKDINDVLALQVGMQQSINMDDAAQRRKAIESAVKLAGEMDLMAKLTGVSRKEQEEMMKKAQANMQAEAKLRLITMGKSETEAAAIRNNYYAQQKEAELRGQGQMFKEVFATGTIQSEAAANQVAISGREAQMTIAAARASQVGDSEAATEYNKQARIENSANQRDVNKLQLATLGDQFAAGKTQMESMTANDKYYRAEQAVSLQLEREGKLKNIGDEEKRKLIQDEMIAQAKREQNNENADGTKKAGSESTDALLKVGRAAGDVESAFMEKMVKPLNEKVGPALNSLANVIIPGTVTRNKTAAEGGGQEELGSGAALKKDVQAGKDAANSKKALPKDAIEAIKNSENTSGYFLGGPARASGQVGQAGMDLVVSAVNGVRDEIAKVTRKAEGTTTTGPELAVIGEAGKEHVIPDDKLQTLMQNVKLDGLSKATEALAKIKGSGGAKLEMPKLEMPKLEMPKMEMPKLPKLEMPKMEMPKLEMPKMEMPKMPKLEMPKLEMPKLEMPKMEMPKMEMPKLEMPKLPKLEMPKLPKLEMPKMEMPKLPKLEMPKMEMPKLPKLEMPKMEMPKMDTAMGKDKEFASLAAEISKMGKTGDMSKLDLSSISKSISTSISSVSGGGSTETKRVQNDDSKSAEKELQAAKEQFQIEKQALREKIKEQLGPNASRSDITKAAMSSDEGSTIFKTYNEKFNTLSKQIDAGISIEVTKKASAIEETTKLASEQLSIIKVSNGTLSSMYKDGSKDKLTIAKQDTESLDSMYKDDSKAKLDLAKKINADAFKEAELAKSVIGTSVKGMSDDMIESMIPKGSKIENYYIDMNDKLQNYSADTVAKIEKTTKDSANVVESYSTTTSSSSKKITADMSKTVSTATTPGTAAGAVVAPVVDMASMSKMVNTTVSSATSPGAATAEAPVDDAATDKWKKWITQSGEFKADAERETAIKTTESIKARLADRQSQVAALEQTATQRELTDKEKSDLTIAQSGVRRATNNLKDQETRMVAIDQLEKQGSAKIVDSKKSEVADVVKQTEDGKAKALDSKKSEVAEITKNEETKKASVVAQSIFSSMATIGLTDNQRKMFGEFSTLSKEDSDKKKESLSEEMASAMGANKAALAARDAIEEKAELEGRKMTEAEEAQRTALTLEMNSSAARIDSAAEAQKVLGKADSEREFQAKVQATQVTAQAEASQRLAEITKENSLKQVDAYQVTTSAGKTLADNMAENTVKYKEEQRKELEFKQIGLTQGAEAEAKARQESLKQTEATALADAAKTTGKPGESALAQTVAKAKEQSETEKLKAEYAKMSTSMDADPKKLQELKGKIDSAEAKEKDQTKPKKGIADMFGDMFAEIKLPDVQKITSTATRINPPEDVAKKAEEDKKAKATADAKAAEAKKPAESAKSTGEVTLKEVHASLEHLNKSMAQMLTYTQQTATAAQQQVKATKNLSGNKFS